ncbi:hypothetical protein ONZ45_g19490 [Pleurotus djamor]|nr:hypothetical protein ONZ45_g19490 [Pleurotus djamor]
MPCPFLLFIDGKHFDIERPAIDSPLSCPYQELPNPCAFTTLRYEALKPHLQSSHPSAEAMDTSSPASQNDSPELRTGITAPSTSTDSPSSQNPFVLPLPNHSPTSSLGIVASGQGSDPSHPMSLRRRSGGSQRGGDAPPSPHMSGTALGREGAINPPASATASAAASSLQGQEGASLHDVVKQRRPGLAPSVTLAPSITSAASPTPTSVASPDPESALIVTPLGRQYSYCFHALHRVLLCMSCKIALLPKNLPGHIQKSHKTRLSPATKEAISLDIQKHDISQQSDVVAPPSPGCAPVEGLQLRHNGYACDIDGCTYVSGTLKTMKNHHGTDHPEYSFFPDRRSVSYQNFFPQAHRLYFEVNPALAHVPRDSFKEAFLRNVAPVHITSSTFHVPSSDDEVPLLVQNMGWFDRIKPHLGSQKSIAAVRALVSLPKPGDPYQKLTQGFFKYLKNIQTHALQDDLIIRRMLHTYPM